MPKRYGYHPTPPERPILLRCPSCGSEDWKLTGVLYDGQGYTRKECEACGHIYYDDIPEEAQHLV